MGLLVAAVVGYYETIARSITRDITRFTRIYRNITRVVLGACQESTSHIVDRLSPIVRTFLGDLVVVVVVVVLK